MGKNPNIVALYRMAEESRKDSDNIYKKNKPDYINNENCLSNFRNYFPERIVVFGDKLKQSESIAQQYADEYIATKSHGKVDTYKECIDYALTLSSDTIVYFIEDDYLHRTAIAPLLQEGLKRFEYVTLYDHPDKHGRNIRTNIVTSESIHWMRTISTTHTFAAKVKTIIEDEELLKSFDNMKISDHQMWIDIMRTGRTLGSCIPGCSTHGEIEHMSPTCNWEEYA